MIDFDNLISAIIWTIYLLGLIYFVGTIIENILRFLGFITGG